jgi:hypothetical protein
MVTVPTKDVGEVKDCFRGAVGYQWSLEEGCEDYIKKELGIK